MGGSAESNGNQSRSPSKLSEAAPSLHFCPTTMDVFSHFGRLDELIRMVYQGFDRFVVLSHVNESAWTIHLALKGPAGRWWRGSWSAQDVLHIVVRLRLSPFPKITR